MLITQARPAVPWLGVAAFISGSLLAWLVRYGTAVILPGLQADFNADEPALGMLAAAYFWPYALMQPVAGVLADSWGPRRSLAVWLTVARAGTVLFAVAPVYPSASIAHALGGVGVGTIVISGFIAIGQWFDAKRFGTLSGLFTATGPLGRLLAARSLAVAAIRNCPVGAAEQSRPHADG